MMKVRKKPVEVEAVLWDGMNFLEVKDFVGENFSTILFAIRNGRLVRESQNI